MNTFGSNELFSQPTAGERHPTHILRNAQGSSIASELHSQRNEDNLIVDRENNIFGVFDGVGGYEGGEIASQTAVQIATDRASESGHFSDLGAVGDYLYDVLLDANIAIVEAAPKAATTGVLVKIHTIDEIVYASIAHIGDSRAYLLQDGILKAITVDHTPFREPGHTQDAMLQQERLANTDTISVLSPQDIAAFKRRNIIGACLGRDNDIHVDIKHFIVEPGDVLILTSDGVHDNLTTSEMQHILTDTRYADMADVLTHEANKRAKQPHLRAKMDDITAVVVSI